MNHKRGFTLAELLVVIGIIAVLTSIAIPVFSTQGEKAREANDVANIRNAYAKVLNAALLGDTESPNADGVIYAHDRWYINVSLVQEVNDWQGMKEADLSIGGVTPSSSTNWIGKPSKKGKCTIAYTVDGGAVIAFDHNFAPIMMDFVINADGPYKGYTIPQLIRNLGFEMVESSGSTGQYMNSEIRHQLGLHDSDQFSYKIMPASNGNKNQYEIYISEDYELKTNSKKGASDVGSLTVTGYLYDSATNSIIQRGTPQTITIYTNKQGQEKMDVYGNQNVKAADPTNPVYDWSLSPEDP